MLFNWTVVAGELAIQVFSTFLEACGSVILTPKCLVLVNGTSTGDADIEVGKGSCVVVAREESVVVLIEFIRRINSSNNSCVQLDS